MWIPHVPVPWLSNVHCSSAFQQCVLQPDISVLYNQSEGGGHP
jgi:hypothetical protein